MTVPPNDDAPYQGDIRSNTSSGLGGLFIQLAAIANGLAALPQLLAAVQQIRDDIRKLVGAAPAPADWNGIVSYINNAIGTEEYVSSGAYFDVLTQLNATRELNFRVSRWLTGPNTEPEVGRGDVLVTTVTTANGHLNAIRGFANEQSSVLGFVGDAPAGKTIKALLEENRVESERAADCCEEGGTDPDPDPDPEELPPPSAENACELSGGIARATGFVLRQSAGGTDTYSIQFDTIGTVSAGAISSVPANSPDAGVDVLLPNEDLIFCLAWNLGSGTVPSGASRINMGVSPDIGAGSAASVSLAVGEGSSSPTPRDEGFHILYEVTVPTGNGPPPLNFFLQWGPQPV